MATRIIDIAKAAQVSQATVSLVLNNKGNVSEEVRARVLAEAKRLDYDMTRVRGASSGGTIQFVKVAKHGHILNQRHNEFIAEYILGVENRAHEIGFSVEVLFRQGVAGATPAGGNDSAIGSVLLATELDRADLAELAGSATPTVAIDAAHALVPMDFVDMDNQDSVFQIVGHLVAAGHRRIGMVRGSYATPNFRARETAFWEACELFALDRDAGAVVSVDSTFDGAYRDMQTYLARRQPLPTALFCLNDIIAFGAMRALTEVGLRIPQDISVVGFDNLHASNYSAPPLTSIEVPKQQIGARAVDALVARIKAPDAPFITTLVRGSLVERSSVAPKRAAVHGGLSEVAR